MRLILVRHGIAIDRDDPDCPPDAERHLTQEGMHLTRQAAQGLLVMKATVDVILTSPLLRAVQTAQIVAEVFDRKKSSVVVTENLLPHRDPGIFLAGLAEHADSDVLAVGHAPHMDELLARAVGIQDGAVTSLKKAGAALLELGEDLLPPARLVWVLPAGTLRRLSKAR
jgi:phosphohistidine phosphatase